MKFPFFIFLFCSITCYAQDYRDQAKAYEERQRANKESEKHIHQQYLNNLPNEIGSKSTGTGQSWLDKQRQAEKEIQNWLDSRKRQQDAPTGKSREERQRERRIEIYDNEMKNLLLVEKKQFVIDLQAEGFRQHEAYDLVTYTVTGALIETMAKHAVEVDHARSSFRSYKQEKTTSNYDRLLQLIFGFRISGMTAIDALQEMKIRFKDKVRDIDFAIMEVMPVLQQNRHQSIPEQMRPESDKKSIADTFIYLLENYPVEASRIATKEDNSPFDNIYFKRWLSDKKDTEKKAAICLAIMQGEDERKPLIRNYNYLAKGYQHYLKRLEACTDFFAVNMSYIKQLSAADWLKISAAKGIPATDIMSYFGIYTYPTNATLDNIVRGNDGKGYQDYGNFAKYGFPKITKELAETGDADAMNAYAVRIAARLEKKLPQADAIKWLYMAVDAGSFMAAMNLNLARDWKIPEYMTEANLKIADQKILDFFKKASAKDNWEAASLFSQNNWSAVINSNGRQKVLAKILVNQAAAKGSVEAQNCLKTTPQLTEEKFKQ